MAGVNKVILVGNLGRDPEVRYAQSGTAVAKINLAVNERRKQGDEWIDHTEWVRVTCFGRTAENVGKYLAKGRSIYVEGRMQTSKYTDREGQEKWSTEVVANNIVFLASGGDGNRDDFGGGGRQGNGGSRGGANRGGDSSRSGGSDDGFYDDDLPF